MMRRTAVRSGMIEGVVIGVRCCRVGRGEEGLRSPSHHAAIGGGARDGGGGDEDANGGTGAAPNGRIAPLSKHAGERMPAAGSTGA